MATLDYIHANHDKSVLSFIFVATFAVLILVAVLSSLSLISTSWFLLPMSWFVGAIMVWAYDKWLNKKYTKK